MTSDRSGRLRVADRPTVVDDGNEMVAPKKPLPGSGKLIEWGSDKRVPTVKAHRTLLASYPPLERSHMESSPWKRTMEDLLDGIERELRPSAPARTRLGLNAFRVRLRARRIVGGQTCFEQELEGFIDKHFAVRGAAERYISAIMIPAVDAANVALKKADTILARARARLRLS